MIRTIRIAIARRAYDRATRDYVAYQAQLGFWTLGMAMALHTRLITCERHLSRLINS